MERETPEKDRIVEHLLAELALMIRSGTIDIDGPEGAMVDPQFLANNLDDWRNMLMLHRDEGVTVRQVAALSALDAYLLVLSDADDPPLWECEALQSRPEWDDVRTLAALAIDAFRA